MAFLTSANGRKAVHIVTIIGVSLLLSSCELFKNQLEYDRGAARDRQDYRDVLAPQPVPPEDTSANDIPDLQPMVSTPEELRLPSPLVTVSVNQTVSLRDLMFELAHQADVDIELDPQIHGSIIFTAKERPFDQVVDRICEMSGLRYTYKDNVLRVELDRPYVKNYSVDFVNATRSSSSSIKTSLSLSEAAGDTTSGSGGGGSDASVSTSASGDLWADLNAGIEQVLTASDTHVSLATMDDPVATPVSPLPAQSADPSAPPPLPGDASVAPLPAARSPTLNVSTPKGEPVIPNAPATFTISKQAGIVTVFASERQQKLVQKFLEDFRRRATTQILIEAKVLQVDLSDEFATGIDWSQMNLTGLSTWSAHLPIPELSPEASGTVTGVLRTGNDVNAAIQMISRFGTVRALSSPRVTVLNNQPAIVNVAQNNVYFEFDVQITEGTDSNPPRITVDSTQKGIPEGVLMTVIPTANPDTGDITMTLRPSVSKITGFIADPTVPLSLAFNGLDPSLAPANQIPEVSVQEIDSTLRLRSGQVMVMGGLMRDGNQVEDQGVPVLADLPWIGKAFANHKDKVTKSELVIFLKAQVVQGSNVDDMDKKVYKQFGMDRRPARM
jgi:general secretion pathway protein D